MRLTLRCAILVGAVLAETGALGVILPYRVRTRDFSAWTPGTRGDTNTIGMAGATIAVPTNISAAETNPAGFAMLTGRVSAQINKTSFNDLRIQHNRDLIESSQWGLSVSPTPWAYSLAYYSPFTESGIYVSPNTGDAVKTEVSLKELRFTVGRVFFSNKLALGVSLEAVKAVRELDGASSNAFGFSYRTGALLRLPGHFLMGASFAPGISVGPSSNPDPQIVIPGFNRAVIQPLQVGAGVGWIPSRYFKAGVSATYIGRSHNTGLLADESITTGASPTWVPRLGASYVFAEFANFKMEGSAGSYFETSRLDGQFNRLHLTAGVEANLFFVNLGTGFDISSGYRNLIVSVGIDIVRSLRAFDIIPKETGSPYNGILPPIEEVVADGHYGALSPNARKELKPDTVEQVRKIVEDVSGNIAKKVMGQPTTVEANKSNEKKKQKSKKRSTSARSKRVSESKSVRPNPNSVSTP